jgi:hypothetical protein
MADCNDKLRKLFPPEVSDQMIKEVVADLVELKKTVGGDTAKFRQAAKERIESRRLVSAERRRQRAENILKIESALEFMRQPAFEGDPAEALQAFLGGTAGRKSIGGFDSVWREAQSVEHSLKASLFNGLEAVGVPKNIMRDGSLDREIAVELFERRAGGEPGKSGSKVAQSIADVVHTVNKQMLQAKQLAGSSVREFDGYITKQTHDSELIRQAGKDQWVEKVRPLLNREAMSREKTYTDAEFSKLLGGVYDDIVDGRHEIALGEGADDLLVLDASTNINRKLARSRTLIFNDGESFHSYNREFGKKTILEGVLADISFTGRNVALMSRLGTNPESAWKIIKAKVKDGLDDAAREKFNAGEAKIDSLFAHVQGLPSVPGRSLMAKVGAGTRSVASMSMLGGSIFSAAGPDWTTSALLLKSATGKNLLEGHLDLLNNYLKVLPAEGRKAAARKLDLALSTMIGQYNEKFSLKDDLPSKWSKMADFFYRATLLPQHTEIAKTASAVTFSAALAEQAGRSFQEVEPRLRQVLEGYRIQAPEWEVLRKSVDDFDGTPLITSEAVDRIPDGELKAAMEAHDVKGSIEKFRTATKRKLVSYYSDYAELGSLEPGVRAQNFLIRGTSADSAQGQLLRFIGQFKAPSLRMQEVASRVALSNPEKSARTLRESIFQNKGDNVALAQMMLVLTGMGYMSLTLKDLATGKTPRDPTDPETLKQAFLRGGGAGMYGEMLLGEYDRGYKNVLKGLAGPVLGGQLVDATTLATRARTGQLTAGEALRTVGKNTPFQNLFYLRTAMDHLILNEVNEGLNPGYLDRLRRRMDSTPGLFTDSQESLFGR